MRAATALMSRAVRPLAYNGGRRYRSAEAIGRRKLGKLNCRPTVVIKAEAAVFVLFFFLSRQVRALQYINLYSPEKRQQRKNTAAQA